MRKLIAICAVCVCVLLTTAAWGNIIVVSFDENGHGNVNNNGVITPLTYLITRGTLTYYPGTSYPGFPMDSPGELVVMEPGTTTISDVLRFTGSIGVYSDNSDGVDSLADTGIPTTLMTNLVYMDEVGPEGGPNGVVYTPTSGQPGWSTTDAVTYNFISDTPEPATMCLLGLGGLLLRRKRRA